MSPQPDLSVRQLCALYLEHARRVYVRFDGTPTKTPVNIELALRVLIELHGDLPAAGLTRRDVKRLRGQWVLAGLTRTTVNDRVGSIQRAWSWAGEMGLLDEDAAEELRLIRPLRRGLAPEGRGVGPVDSNDVLRTAACCRPDLRDLLCFLLVTGCRVGEGRLAKSAEVDRVTWTLRPRWHKTARHGCARIIPLNREARRLVEPRLGRPFIFGPGEGLKPYHGDAICTGVTRACELAGVERWSPGQIRHTCAEKVLKLHGLEHARALLGHTTDRCTRRYAGSGEGPALREAVDALVSFA